MNSFLYYLSPVQAQRGVRERLWWVSGIQLGSTYYMEVNASFSLASATKEKDTQKVWHFSSGGEKLAKKDKIKYIS